MEIVFDREKMLSAFTAASSVASSKSPKQILQAYIRLAASGQQVSIWATDLEITVQVVVPEAQIVRPGEVLLPIEQVGRILRENTDTQMKLDYSGSLLTISGRNNYQIPVPDVNDYPDVDLLDVVLTRQVPAKSFVELAKRTVFATETESTRYAMGGVHVELQPQQITAVATDGRRLVKFDLDCENVGGGSEVTSALVPRRGMEVLERVLAGLDEPVKLGCSPGAFGVEASGFLFRTQQIEGRFPNWRDVLVRLKKDNPVELVVEPMLAAVRQAAIMCDADNRGLVFQLGEGVLKINAQSATGGAAHVELPVGYDGPPIEVVLDHQYLIDFLRVVDPLSVLTAYFPASDGAAHFHTADKYLYVLMPMAKKR